MKSKAFYLFLIVPTMLVTMHFSNAAFGANPDTLYRHITINLDYFYGIKEIKLLKDSLYNAALTGKLKPYKNDSFNIIYTPEDVVSRRRYELPRFISPYLDMEPLDTNVYYGISDLTSFAICFKTVYNSENNYFTLDIAGLSLNFGLNIYGQIIPDIPLFYITKADLIRLLGIKEAEELFKNSYLAMLKAINYEKLVLPDNLAFFNADMSNYLGIVTIDEINTKIYKSLCNGLNEQNKPIIAYKSNNFKTAYTSNEASKRGSYSEIVEILSDVYDPNSAMKDTTIINPIRIEGHKSYSISNTWQYNPKTYTLTTEIAGFRLFVPLENENREKVDSPLFWIKWKDAEAIYSPIELSVLKYAFYQALVNFKDNHIK